MRDNVRLLSGSKEHTDCGNRHDGSRGPSQDFERSLPILTRPRRAKPTELLVLSNVPFSPREEFARITNPCGSL
jgi:hypothetical protein